MTVKPFLLIVPIGVVVKFTVCVCVCFFFYKYSYDDCSDSKIMLCFRVMISLISFS